MSKRKAAAEEGSSSTQKPARDDENAERRLKKRKSSAKVTDTGSEETAQETPRKKSKKSKKSKEKEGGSGSVEVEISEKKTTKNKIPTDSAAEDVIRKSKRSKGVEIGVDEGRKKSKVSAKAKEAHLEEGKEKSSKKAKETELQAGENRSSEKGEETQPEEGRKAKKSQLEGEKEGSSKKAKETQLEAGKKKSSKKTKETQPETGEKEGSLENATENEHEEVVKKSKSSKKAKKSQPDQLPSDVILSKLSRKEKESSGLPNLVANYMRPLPANVEEFLAMRRRALNAPDPENDDRPPSIMHIHKTNYNKFRSYLPTYCQGQFATQEREAVHLAITHYLNEHDIPKDDLPLLVRRLTKIDGMVNPYSDSKYARWLTQVLRDSRINRNLDQITKYIKRAYITPQAGIPQFRANGTFEWTEENDASLRDMVAKGWKWADMDRAFGLADNSSRFRYRNHLDRGNNAALGTRWSKKLEKSLVAAVKFVMRRDGLKQHQDINDWKTVATFVEDKSADECKQHWNENGNTLWETRKKRSSPSWTLEDDRKLLTRMQELYGGAVNEGDIIWESLRLPEWGSWQSTKFTQQWKKARERVSNYEQYTFGEAIKLALKALLVGDFKSEAIAVDSDEDDANQDKSSEDTEESDEEDTTSTSSPSTSPVLKAEPPTQTPEVYDFAL
ncbi:hypothetical protein DFS34DRAFT_648173 [Phlyctochytrium arcticum]|nr:hypothetical protein DFS34DRAFT_648173 [Phlyctochytrium arcticum]